MINREKSTVMSKQYSNRILLSFQKRLRTVSLPLWIFSTYLIAVLANAAPITEKPFSKLSGQNNKALYLKVAKMLSHGEMPEVINSSQYFAIKKSTDMMRQRRIETPKKWSTSQQLKLFKSLVAMRDYLVKSDVGIFSEKSPGRNPRATAASLDQVIVREGKKLLKSLEPGSDQNWVKYQTYSVNHRDFESSKALNAMTKLRQVDKRIKARIFLLSVPKNLQNVGRSLTKWSASYKNFRKVALGLDPHGRVYGNLVLAEWFTSVGATNANFEKSFLEILNDTLKRARGTSPRVQEKVSYDIYRILETTQKGRLDFTKIPLRPSMFKNPTAATALAERLALSTKASNNLNAAKKIYYSVANDKTFAAHRMKALRRLIDWENEAFKRTRKSATLEADTKYQLGLLRKEEKLSPEGKKHESYLLGLYLSLVKKSIEGCHANVKKSAKSLSSCEPQFLSLRTRYLNFVKPPKDVAASLAFMVGRLYASAGAHTKSVKEHMSAFRMTPSSKFKNQNLDLAINSQHVLSKWPKKLTWPPQSPNALKKESLGLLALFGLKSKMTKNIDWYLEAQRGLILYKFASPVKASDLWASKLSSSIKGDAASKAAYLTSTTYKKSKLWDQLEKVSRLFLKTRLTPRLGRNSVNPKEDLGDALYFGGERAYLTKNFSKAIDKLKEYTAKYERKNEPTARWYLANSLWNSKDHMAGISELFTLVKNYRGPDPWPKATLTGVVWAGATARESEHLYFLETALKHKVTKDPIKLHSEAAQLYAGQEKYLDFIRHSEAIVNLSNRNPVLQDDERAKILDVIVKHGKASDAVVYANKILKVSKSRRLKARALHAITLLGKHSTTDLKALASDLNALGADGTDLAAEAAAEVRFQLAVRSVVSSDFAPKQIASLKNPLSAIQDYEKSALKYFKIFRSVCELRVFQQCSKAMNNYVSISKKLTALMEPIYINETLDEKTVSTFNGSKSSILKKLSDLEKYALDLAYQSVARGGNTPETVQAVLWEKGADWNFEPVSSSPGNAYLEWRENG